MIPPVKPNRLWNLNRAHPLARRLAFAYFARWTGDRADLSMRGYDLTYGSTSKVVMSQAGPAFLFDGTTNSTFNPAGQPIITSDGSFTGDCALMVVANPISEGNMRFLIVQRIESGGFNQMLIGANLDNNLTGAEAGYITAGCFNTTNSYQGRCRKSGAANGQMHAWLYVRRATGATTCRYELWEDGELVAVSADNVSIATISMSTSSAAFGIGMRPGSAPNYANCHVPMAVGWNWGPPPPLCSMVTRNPWAMIERPFEQILTNTVASVPAAFAPHRPFLMFQP